ncbi:MAG: hypothetical protein EXQ71_07360 [Acidimicrobiia bacterium]|nr:hypothetical protein [Acidimicrobiia bacterium]
MSEPKIVITGTGRAGTTLLVQLLDDLGLDTGLAEGKLSAYRPRARAGLESRVDDPEAPTVVKDMTLGFRIRALLEGGAVEFGHVIIPDRRMDVAVASRIRAASYGRRPFRQGGLTGTLRATEQERLLISARAEILAVLAEFDVPYTILEFPRFAFDAAYFHDALGSILPGVSLSDVQLSLDRCVRPEMIHESVLGRRERWRTRATTAWMVVYWFPAARVRGWINPKREQRKMLASVGAAKRQEALLIQAERRAGRFPGPAHDPRDTHGSTPPT